MKPKFLTTLSILGNQVTLDVKHSAPQKSTLVVHMVVRGKKSTNRDSKSLLRNMSERKSMSILPCSHLVETVFRCTPNEQIELPT